MMQGFNIEEMKIDKYREKTIKFYDKVSHYDLIFCGDFDQVNKEYPVYSDLLCDLKEADKEKQVHVWIHSCGGSVSTLIALIQQLEEFEYVVTIGLGEIDSAGFMLWCKGDERYLSPSTLCMYHAMSSGMGGKADEIKDYGDVLKKYQGFFEQNVSQILTAEQIEKGRYTQIWILGNDLIDRKVAFDYINYKKREIPAPLVAYKIGEECYVKTNQGLYEKIMPTDTTFTRRQIMQNKIIEEREYGSFLQKKEEIGEEFVNFFKLFLDSKSKILREDGFITDSYLLESWNHFSNDCKTVEELKDKFERWVEVFSNNLKIKKKVVRGKKKGFTVKIVQEGER